MAIDTATATMSDEEERVQQNEAQTAQNGEDRMREFCKDYNLVYMAELVKVSRSQTETLNNLRDDILFQPDPAMLEEHSENETEDDLNLNTAVNALLDPSSESTATEGERNAENKRRPIPAPDNCKHLTSVLANDEIWDLMARKTKTVPKSSGAT